MNVGTRSGPEPDWNQYWNLTSKKRRFLEFMRRIYYAKVFTADVLKNSEPGDAILESGCGSGTYLKLLEEKGRICYGIDRSDKALRISKKNCSSVASADIGNIPFRDKSFNVNFNQGVMEHFTDEEFLTYLKEMKRVSKIVIIIVPCKWSILRIYDFIGVDPEERFFSKKKVFDLMKPDFEKVKVRYMWESGFLSLVAIGYTEP